MVYGDNMNKKQIQIRPQQIGYGELKREEFQFLQQKYKREEKETNKKKIGGR